MRTFIKFFIAIVFLSQLQGSNSVSSDSHDLLYRQEHGQQCSNVSDPQIFPELTCLPWPNRVGPYGVRLLRLGYCTTYDDNSGIQSFATCSYIFSDAFEVQKQGDGDGGMWYIELPKNICALNDFMCGPLNRTGRLCSECKDGYAWTGSDVHWFSNTLFQVYRFLVSDSTVHIHGVGPNHHLLSCHTGFPNQHHDCSHDLLHNGQSIASTMVAVCIRR